MARENLSSEQIKVVWGQVYSEAQRCLRLGNESTEGELGIRLVRPKVAVSRYELERWKSDPGLVDSTNHLIGRVLLVGPEKKSVLGKVEAVLTTDWVYERRWLKLFLSNEELLTQGQYSGLELGSEWGKGQELTWSAWMRQEEVATGVVIARDKIIYTQVVNQGGGVAIASTLPVGFKDVFDKKTGFLLPRPQG